MENSPREELETLMRDDAHRSMGLVLRGLAHEVRNALNPTGLQMAILRRRIDSGQPVDDVLNGLDEALKRAMATLDQVSALGHEFAPGDQDEPGQASLWDRMRAED